MGDTTSRASSELRWPPTPDQWSAVNDELNKIYRLLRTGNLGGSSSATLTDTGVVVGTYGSASKTVTATVESDGRLTALTDQDIAISGTQITSGTIAPARLPGSTNACSVYNSTGQTLTHGTEALLTFDSEDYDAQGMHSTTSNTSRITIQTGGDGVYTFKARVEFSAAFAGVLHIRFYKTGSQVAEATFVGGDVSSGNEAHVTLADLNLVATDYVEVKALVELAAGSGTLSTVSGTGHTTFQCVIAAPQAGVLTQTIAQVVNTETGAVATGTTAIPLDDTIPQSTEGDQYMSLAITPKSASNKLKIEVVAQLSHSVANTWLTAALFQDTGANALAAQMETSPSTSGNVIVTLTHWMTAGTTSATTFKVRCGGNGAGTTTLNGRFSARIYGGVMASSITITEVVP